MVIAKGGAELRHCWSWPDGAEMERVSGMRLMCLCLIGFRKELAQPDRIFLGGPGSRGPDEFPPGSKPNARRCWSNVGALALGHRRRGVGSGHVVSLDQDPDPHGDLGEAEPQLCPTMWNNNLDGRIDVPT